MRRPARIPRIVPVAMKQPDPKRSATHLAFIRTLPCCVCSKGGPSEAAHVRSGTDGGIGMKPSDKWTVPLCHEHHRRQHDIGELAFWSEQCVDPLGLATELWTNSGNDDRGHRAVARTVQAVQMGRADHG
jgi:hypothetical protein